MNRKFWVYLVGAGWFGAVCSIVGFSVTDWQFWLISGSYYLFALPLSWMKETSDVT